MVGTLLLTATLLVTGEGARKPADHDLDLHSDAIGVLGLPLAECPHPVFRVGLTGKVGDKGEGKGTLVLDPSRPATYDEFGFAGGAKDLPVVRLEGTLKFVQAVTKRYTSRRLGAPPEETREYSEEWKLYAFTGPKVTSRLYLAVLGAGHLQRGRFLVRGDDDKVRYVVEMRAPPPQEPCHPGCFPAGTPVTVPGGTRTIERLAVGDVVTTVGPDGTVGRSKVASVFLTDNRLWEVQTETGTLLTTETQPLALAAGGLKPAGELKAGDQLVTWDGRERRKVTVRAVKATGRRAEVFNLVLGEPVTFVAGGYLARSKPPAPAADSTRP